MGVDEIDSRIVFSHQAWEDYQHWIKTDPKIAKRIARLVEDCLQKPFEGIGSPEPLKYELAGYWSRRITKEHRFVYTVKNGQCLVIQCRYHY